jgi:two-component system LytT family response regulator
VPRTIERVAIKNACQVLFLSVSAIDWIEAADHYVCLHVGTQTHLLRWSMAEVDEELEQAAFCRIHRSAIVNLDRVRCLETNQDGAAELVLTDGTRLRLSRRYRRQCRCGWDCAMCSRR